jgi:hypothetical protein
MSLLASAQRMIDHCPTDSPDFDTLTRLIALVHVADALGHLFDALEPDENDAIPNDVRALILRLGADMERG